ncbi:MAG: hypothetical protein AB7O97_07040 [Planctomycetota bacterium]
MLNADLRALRNLWRTKDGRTALLGNAIVVGCGALGAWFVGRGLFGSRVVREALRQDLDPDLARTVYALLLLPPLLLVFGGGMAQLGVELYRAPQVPLLLTAPLRAGRLLARAFARSLFGWWMFGSAVSTALAVALAQRAGWSWAPVPAMPLATLLLMGPVVATLVLAKVALVRWCSAPWLRRLFTAIQATFAIALILALLLGLVRGRDLNARLGEWLGATAGLPWPVEAPAAWPAALAGFAQSPSWLACGFALALASALPLLLAARWYRASYDVSLAADTGAVSARARSRVWPSTPLRSLLQKSRAETLRVTSNLAFYFVLAALLVLSLALGEGRDRGAMPAELHAAFELAAGWQTIALLTSTLLFLAVIGGEQPQIALLASAPLSRRTLLTARLVTVATPLVATMAVAAVAGPFVLGAPLLGVAWYILLALPYLLWLLALVLVFGTWPAFMRVNEATPLAGNLRSTVPVICIGVLGGVGMYPVLRLRGVLTREWAAVAAEPAAAVPAAPWSFCGVSWLVATVAFALGFALASRNFARLLGPQDG